MAGEIMVGYNGTDGAKHALDVAIDLAKDLSAPLTVAFAYGVAHMAEARDHELALKEAGRADRGWRRAGQGGRRRRGGAPDRRQARRGAGRGR